MQNTPKTLVQEFKDRIVQWKEQYPDMSMVFNSELESINFAAVKLIIVVDNPGTEEFARGIYLVPDPTGRSRETTAGKIAKDFFDYLGISREQLVILNKTPIHSSLTDGLKPFRKTHLQLIQETQHYMASLTFRMHQAVAMHQSDIKVWVCGFGGCWNAGKREWVFRRRDQKNHSSATLPEFFERISSLYSQAPAKLQSQLHVVRHFSRHQIFQDIDGIETKSLRGVVESGMGKEEVVRQLCSLDYGHLLLQSHSPYFK